MRQNKTKCPTWNPIRLEFVRQTSVPSPDESFGYIKYYSSSNPSWSRRPETKLEIGRNGFFKYKKLEIEVSFIFPAFIFTLYSLLFRFVFIARKTFNIREKELDKNIFPNTELRNLFVFCVEPLYILVSPPILITVRLIQVFAELIITLSDSTCGLLERELNKILITVSKYSKIHLLSLLSSQDENGGNIHW